MEIPYALKAVRKNWSNPNWWPIVFNSEIVGRIHSITRSNSGIPIPEADWDNLIILDGCRFDTFEEVSSEYSMDGELKKQISKGSGSPEFLRKNFKGKDLNDVVYVTANPFVEKVLDDPFAHTENVWKDGWDEAEETVLPSTLISRAKALMETYPNKRFVLHFMQPHHPFVGETRIEDDSGFVGAIAKSTGEEVPNVEFVWEKLRAGKLDEQTVQKAYQDNLRFVLDQVLPFINEIDGKSVTTSDHGNAFGERATPFPTRVFGHGDRIRIPALIEVPWFEHEYEQRREITEGVSTEDSQHLDEDADIEDRLSALGYKT